MKALQRDSLNEIVGDAMLNGELLRHIEHGDLAVLEGLLRVAVERVSAELSRRETLARFGVQARDPC